MPTTLQVAPLLVLLAGFALAVPYALACWLAPFGACARCHGRDPLCPLCDGTGRRVRLGRRAWTYLRRLHHDAQEPYRPDQRERR
jgi:hypothetical protein